MVYQVVKHRKIQPTVERCDRIQRKMICAQIFLYVTNSHKHRKTTGKFNHRLYYLANTTSRCEFILKYNLYQNLILISGLYQHRSNAPKKRSTARGCLGHGASRFNVIVYQVANHDKFNLWLNSGAILCGQQNTDKYFYAPTCFSYTPENNGHIQPQVVLLCEHNTIMRIYTKIQLILEFNLGFQEFANVAPTNQP